MPKLRRIDIESNQNLLERAKEFAHRLKETLPVTEVYLYGSVATGEVHEGSDIDLIIVGDFKERLFERIGKVLDLTDLPKALKSKDNPFIKAVLKEAIRLV